MVYKFGCPKVIRGGGGGGAATSFYSVNLCRQFNNILLKIICPKLFPKSFCLLLNFSTELFETEFTFLTFCPKMICHKF